MSLDPKLDHLRRQVALNPKSVEAVEAVEALPKFPWRTFSERGLLRTNWYTGADTGKRKEITWLNRRALTTRF